jgi:LAS superfamily LD-carboxypeptidase LdcB
MELINPRTLTGIVLVAVSVTALAGCASGTGVLDRPVASSSDMSSPALTAASDQTIGDRVVTSADGLIESAPISSLRDSPAITHLDDALRDAVEQASRAAAADGVELLVNSGWRSEHYQQALLTQGIERYGSLEAARRWVNTPEKSTHVRGKAVDIGPTDADSWLSQHGDRFGLCQTYANEMWHFELATTPGGTCPAMLPDGAAG